MNLEQALSLTQDEINALSTDELIDLAAKVEQKRSVLRQEKLKDLTDEQVKVLYQKAQDEIMQTKGRDLNRMMVSMVTSIACEEEAVRRGGKLARWLFEELTEDLPSKD